MRDYWMHFRWTHTPDAQKDCFGMCSSCFGTCFIFDNDCNIKQVLQLDAIERATVICSNAGHTGNSAGTGFVGAGVRYLLQCLYCSTAGSGSGHTVKNMLCEEDRLEWKKHFRT